MQATLTLDDDLLNELRRSLGVEEASVIVEQALVEMRRRLAIERIIAMGGSDPEAKAAPRRRPTYFLNPED